MTRILHYMRESANPRAAGRVEISRFLTSQTNTFAGLGLVTGIAAFLV